MFYDYPTYRVLESEINNPILLDPKVFHNSVSHFFGQYFVRRFYTKFVFYTVSYLNNQNQIEFESPDGFELSSDFVSTFDFKVNESITNGFNTFFKELKNDIRTNQSISLTKILLNQKKSKDFVLIYSNEDYNNIPKVELKMNQLNLKFLNYSDNFNEFKILNSLKINNLIKKVNLSIYTNNEFELYSKYIWKYYNFMRWFHSITNNLDLIIHCFCSDLIDTKTSYMVTFATTQTLKDHELSFVSLLLYQINSTRFLEKNQDKIKIDRLENISSSSHVVKTTLNGLFSPTINTLLSRYENDVDIQNLAEAKERVINYADFISLSTKISITNPQPDELLKLLEYYHIYKDYEFKPSEILQKLIKGNEQGNSKVNVKLDIPDNFDKNLNDFFSLKEKNLFPGDYFYELLFLTIIENAIEHGYIILTNPKIDIQCILSSDCIIFKNEAKPSENMKIRKTGNFKVYDNIFSILENVSFETSIINNIYELKFNKI